MSHGIVLSNGVDTLDLRRDETKPLHGLYCRDWSDLLAAPAKRGRNRTVPGERGVAERPRVAGALRALLHIQAVGADHDDCLELLEDLADLLDYDGMLEVTVHRGSLSALSGELQVEDPDTPQFVSDAVARLVVDVTVPAGRLEAAS